MAKTFSDQFKLNLPHVFEGSHIILFAHNPNYKQDDYIKVLDQDIKNKRLAPEKKADVLNYAFSFVDMNTDNKGNNGNWTKAQTYLALGNTLHTLARLKIDSTPLEGVDSYLIAKEFQKELNGYQCDVALAIGYHHPEEDYKAKLPKSRLPLTEVVIRL